MGQLLHRFDKPTAPQLTANDAALTTRQQCMGGTLQQNATNLAMPPFLFAPAEQLPLLMTPPSCEDQPDVPL